MRDEIRDLAKRHTSLFIFKSRQLTIILLIAAIILFAGCAQPLPETTLSPSTVSSLALKPISGEALIEKLFQGGVNCLTEDDFIALYNSIPQQQLNGLSVSEMTAFINLFKTKVPRLTKNTTCEATRTDRQSLQFSDANTEYQPNGNYQWLADILIDPTTDQDLYRLKFIAQGDLLNPIIYVFFLDVKSDLPVLPINFIRGLISLPQQVQQLESIFKSGDAALLEPFTRLGLISDLSVAQRKAQLEIDIYNETIKAAGENQLIIDSTRMMSETDEVPGQATLIWQGDLDSTQTSVMPKLITAYIARDGQLKIRQLPYESSYFPAKTVTSHEQTLTLGDEYDQSAIVRFFGTNLTYKRAEPETFIFTNTPMQAHYFGQNTISLVGQHSQDQQNYAGNILLIALSEGPISLAGQVALGAGIQEIFTTWPLLEDCYLPAYAGGRFGTEYADVVSVAREQYFTLRIKDGLLQSIHMELFAD